MAWLAVDKNGDEYIYEREPIRNMDYNIWELDTIWLYAEFPKGSINKLIGKDLTWDDEPVEI